MAQNQAQLDVLAEHERIKRSSALPVFVGIPGKDILSARDYIDRLESSAQIAGWATDARKIAEFTQLLRQDALDWWKSLADFGIDLTVWNTVKAQFLRDYEKKYSAKTLCANFKEVHQRPHETVRDFWARVSALFRKMYEMAPEDVASIDDHVDTAAMTNAEITATKAAIKYGLECSKKFVQTQMFVAGLREELRHRVMEGGKTKTLDIVRYAQEMEQIEEEKRAKRMPLGGIKAIEETTAPEPEEEEFVPDHLTEEEVGAINAIRFQRGKGPLRRRPPGPGGPRPQNQQQKKTIQCRYCRKFGHLQKECRSRIRDQAPEVDAQGKPYGSTLPGPSGGGGGARPKIHAVQELVDHVSDYSAAAISAIEEMRADYENAKTHLNW
jgi:hypothetical protein